MAKQKDEIIIDVKVDEDGSAQQSTEQLAKSVDELSEATKKLEKERGKLDLTTKEGRKEAANLNKQIEENTDTLKKNEKALKDGKTSNEGFFGTIEKGVPSIGQATAALKSMINPITAGIAILGGLAAAYAKSSTGARDLARAQDILSYASTTFFEGLGKTLGGGNEGISGAMLKFISFFSESSAAVLGAAARAGEELRKLGAEYKNAQGFAKTFEAAAESARIERDNEANSFTARLKAADAVEQNINATKTVRVNILEREIVLIKQNNADWQENIAIQEELADKRREIRDIEEEVKGKLTENIMATKALYKAQVDAATAASEKLREARIAELERGLQNEHEWFLMSEEQRIEHKEREAQIELAADQGVADLRVQIAEQTAERLAETEKALAERQVLINKFRIAGMRLMNEKFFKDNRNLQIAGNILFQKDQLKQVAIDTYAGAIAAYRAMVGIPYVGPILAPIAAAAVTALGLYTASQIVGVKFAEGGKVGRFHGKSHAEGGENYVNTKTGHRINVEAGENFYVLKRTASEEINRLSAINTRHGGRSFTEGKTHYFNAEGGQIYSPTIVNQVDIGAVVKETLRNAKFVVGVADILKGIDNKVQVEETATIV